MDFMKYYGKLKSLVIDKNFTMLNSQIISEEEREITDLIQSIELGKKKILKEGILYKYQVNEMPRIIGAGYVTINKNLETDSKKQTFLLESLENSENGKFLMASALGGIRENYEEIHYGHNLTSLF